MATVMGADMLQELILNPDINDWNLSNDIGSIRYTGIKSSTRTAVNVPNQVILNDGWNQIPNIQKRLPVFVNNLTEQKKHVHSVNYGNNIYCQKDIRHGIFWAIRR